ncbi:MAG TPA: hypothetical protein VNH15_02045 [Elusimicrobiota bacterium]|nr:hypothetical protein [Elusimicrobiota bacterium]
MTDSRGKKASARPRWGTALCVFSLLAAPLGARAKEQPSALESLRRLAPGQARPLPAPPTKAAPSYRPIAPVAANPDSYDDNDAFRRQMLAPGHSDEYLVRTDLGGILLVVEKGYLDARQTAGLVFELQQAVYEVPRLTGRPPLVRKRFTVYVYDRGPISESGVPGALPGETGIMLAWVKEGNAPIFHEMTHLLAGYGRSQSLAEGVACAVQGRLRPGVAAAPFMVAHADPDKEARRILAQDPPGLVEGLGEPGHYSFSSQRIRVDFYWASWSFVDFLLRQDGMAKLWTLIDAGGTPAAYQKIYGTSYASLFADWNQDIKR